jgi:hypothetical protein
MMRQLLFILILLLGVNSTDILLAEEQEKQEETLYTITTSIYLLSEPIEAYFELEAELKKLLEKFPYVSMTSTSIESTDIFLKDTEGSESDGRDI